MLHTIEFIKQNGLEALNSELGIVINQYQDRVVLNYNQINSPKFHPVVRECRGLILSYPSLSILSRPFDRFYNWNEDPDTKNFNISESIVEEKLDGTLIPFYNDGHSWQWATRKMAYAEGSTTFSDKQFRSLCIQTLELMGINSHQFLSSVDPDNTYVFELTTPENRVVTPYGGYQLTLLAVRNKYTGQYQERNLEGFPVPKTYHLNDISDIMSSLKELRAIEEGYVCVSGDWRIKIKNPSYLAISNLRINGGISEKRICYLVVQNDYEEYLHYFPEDRKLFEPYITKYRHLVDEIKQTYQQLEHIENQKDFALKVLDKPFKSLLFNMRKGKDLVELLLNLTDKQCQFLLTGSNRED